MKRIFIALFFLTSILGCGNISVIKTGDKSHLYSEDFLNSISSIKSLYRQGNSDGALQQLNQIQEEGLLPAERAMRRNLMGVILFSKENYEQAIFNFDLALTTSRLDDSLTSQIYLNLSSSYYRLGFMDKSYAVLKMGNPKSMNKLEAAKYYNLNYKLAKELGKDEEELSSLILYLGDKKNLSELKSEPLFEKLVTGFFSLSKREKIKILEDLSEGRPLSVAYLGYLEAEKRYYKGEKSEATDLLNWVEEKFSSNMEISTLVKNFFFRLENYAKVNPGIIGIVLPLSGKKSAYGKRAMLGIDHALQTYSQSLNLESGKKFDVRVEDSEGSGAVEAYRVKKLIDKYHVAAIVGGLFPDEALKEYLEAKKYGVLFISLSQIYLPKEQKDHLLLEIPGSVESHVAELFSDRVLEKFGKRAAILYPSDEKGKAYVNEFWRRASIDNIKVGGIISYNRKENDFRDPVKNLLGLKFPRERQEELELLQDIHSHEKSKSARRLQTLKPQIDFDWIFVPALPKTAVQIIPSFNYFDAFKMNIIGGPSWRSRTLSNESFKLGSIYFVGDNVEAGAATFRESFVKKYSQRPRIIEMRAYDSFNIATSILTNNTFQSRNELDILIRKNPGLSGLTGKWNINEGVWIKDMAFLKLYKGKVSDIFTPVQIDGVQSL